MVHCIVVGCGSKNGKHKGKFHCIPKIISNQGEEHEELTRERRTRWISAVSRGDTKEKRVLESERVCSLHFVSGKAAAVWDKYNVDWVPTENLGKPKDLQRSKEKDLQREAVECRAGRAKDQRKRSLERQEMEAAKKRKELDKSGSIIQKIDFCIDYSSTGKLLCSEPSYSKDFYDGECETVGETTLHTVENSTSTEDFEIVCEGSSNTDTQIDEFNYMVTSSVYRAPDEGFFYSSDKIRFYTGLPSYEVLMVVFEHVAPHIARKHASTILSSFQEFVMVLMKLRLDMPFQDLAYRFVVSLSSVSRIFTSWIVAMDSRLSCFIYWPNRDQLWKAMPMCFQYTFGPKVTVIKDCFEVFIEKPSDLLARAQTFSSYKHHNTIKVLVGITPQGTISFVSQAWGGRTSDKFIAENCGILDKLVPGDTVIADRGFTISESVGLKNGKLVIPAFTKGKAQLDPVDVERSRGIASVRIHVERVIGLLRRKYTILEGTLPTKFLSSTQSQEPLIYCILRVCSALVNCCPSIVPLG